MWKCCCFKWFRFFFFFNYIKEIHFLRIFAYCEISAHACFMSMFSLIKAYHEIRCFNNQTSWEVHQISKTLTLFEFILNNAAISSEQWGSTSGGDTETNKMERMQLLFSRQQLCLAWSGRSKFATVRICTHLDHCWHCFLASIKFDFPIHLIRTLIQLFCYCFSLQ